VATKRYVVYFGMEVDTDYAADAAKEQGVKPATIWCRELDRMLVGHPAVLMMFDTSIIEAGGDTVAFFGSTPPDWKANTRRGDETINDASPHGLALMGQLLEMAGRHGVCTSPDTGGVDSLLRRLLDEFRSHEYNIDWASLAAEFNR